MDLLLCRARQQTRDQRVWIPSVEWNQALTHDTDTYTKKGDTCLQQSLAEKDHLADPTHPEELKRATAPHGDAALSTTSLRSPDDDPPPPTYKPRATPAGGQVYSPRAQAPLRSARRGIPQPTTKWPMGPHGDRYHARPRDHTPRRSGGPHHPAQSPQGRPPPGGRNPGPRPGLSRLRFNELLPRAGHALPDPVHQTALANHGSRALDLGNPHQRNTNQSRPRHTERPPPRRQQLLTCGYHAVHRVLPRVDLSPPLKYPGSTTDKEVHQVRTRICEILAAAANEIEPHGVYILNSECTLFELRADSDQSSSFIIIIIHHASCVMCHASCVMTCWRPSMCFSHSNPKLHFRSELTQPQPHSYGFLRRLYYSFFITL